MDSDKVGVVVWKPSHMLMAVMAVTTILLYLLFQDAFRHMAGYWSQRAEYSHGMLIPFIVAFLVWQKKDQLERLAFAGSWVGFAMVVVGLLLSFAGEFSTLHTIVEYSFVLVLYGLALALLGWPAFKIIMVPMFMLLLMVPLPTFVLNNLSADLQLISSALGVWFIHLFGISVALEGNVIDLGSMRLQVVDACSGLRYLFPLMAFGFIVSYFFKAAMWKRVVLFVSTIPITLAMNSFRIGVIGITVEYWGQSMAEGFLHDFEGWVVFMVCAGLLGIEMWVLTRLSRDRRPLREVFSLEFPQASPQDAVTKRRAATTPLLAAVVAIGVLTLVSMTVPVRDEIIPDRTTFASFPLQVDEWHGRNDKIERIYIDELDFTDYLLANYSDGQTLPINFYVAYYETQRTGESAHSPRTCLPGGGWRITSLVQKEIDGSFVAGTALSVNRALIEMGDKKQLVYYWFQQRGRVIDNEYLVKWYLFWDALTRNRTDGALVRVTTQVRSDDDIKQADQRLSRFVQAVNPILTAYVPL